MIQGLKTFLTSFILVLLINISLSDTCQYKQDGTGLLNNYHEIYINAKCFPCPVQCKTCTSIQDLSCSSGNCQDNFYYDNSTAQCLRCSSLCKTCTGPQQSDCQVCVDGMYFNTGTKNCQNCLFGTNSCSQITVFSCFDRYFLDSQSFTCRKCPSNCFTCTSDSSCQQCQPGYFFVQNNICKKCDSPNCLNCLNSSSCQECQEGYDLVAGQCQLSNCTQSSCVECPLTKDVCSLCDQGYFLFEGKCYFGSSILCGSGQNGSSYGRCASCRDGISYTNDFNPSYCLVAQSQNRAIQYDFRSYSSVTACNSPEFLTKQGSKMISINMTIDPIFQIEVQIRLITKLPSSSINVKFNDTNGYQNFINTNRSIRRSDNLYCKEKSLLSNPQQYLVHRIVESFYANALNPNISLTISDTTNSNDIFLSQVFVKKSLCLVSNCQACFTTGFCSSCKAGYFLEDYECKTQCSEGYFTDSYHQKCVQQCTEGFYLIPEDSKCQKCQPQCSSCMGANYCFKCNSGYFLSGNLCVKTCNDNTTYPDSTQNECKRCKNPCKTCFSIGTNCTSCLQGYLFNGKCIAECPLSYYSNFQSSVAVCSLCATSCKSCSISSDFCTSCNSNLNLYNGKCMNSCPVGYFQFSFNTSTNSTMQTCQKCSSICQQCQGILNNCTTCNMGLLLFTSYSQLLRINGSIYNLEIQTIFNIFSINQNWKAGTCLTKCPKMYFYTDQTNKVCIRCQSSCIQCQNTLNCTKCATQFYLQKGMCLSKCTDPSSYMNNITNICSRCKMPCQTCVTDFQGVNCLTCMDGYYQSVSQTSNVSIECVVRCPVGFYKNDSGVKTCQTCSQNCTECLSLVNCTKCKSGYFLTDKNVCTLEMSCSDGYFFDNSSNSCKRCMQSCKKCQNYSYFCTLCSNSNLVLVPVQGLCIDQCPEGYYQKTIYILSSNSTIVENKSQTQGANYTQLLICKTCPIQCSSCVSQTLCTKCTDQYILFQAACIKACPLTYYGQADSQGKLCQPCPSNCKQCLSPSFCLECAPPSILISNECIDSCFDGYFLNSSPTSQNTTTYQCTICPNQCQKCLSPDNCTSCNFGYFLEYNQTLNKSFCKNFCQPEFFKNQISRTCEACKSPCKTCMNSLICLSCQANLTLLNQNCVQGCPDTFYFETGTSNMTSVCKSCVNPCKKCKSALQCTQCQSGNFLDQASDTCLTKCSYGFYGNNLSKKCEKCSEPCLTCSNSATYCETCMNGFYFRNNLCLSVCPAGTFLDMNDKNSSCQDCDPNCRACQSLAFCTQCKTGYFLYTVSSTLSDSSNITSTQQSCVQTCPDGFYVSEGTRKCEKCYEKCATCIKDKFTCSSCHSGQVLLRNKCVQQCPSSYFLNPGTSVCKECGKWCEQCQSQTSCTNCFSGYLFQGQCAASCPNSFYQDKEKLICQKCMDGCEMCKNEFICEKCSQDDGYVLYQNQCIDSQCPQGFYLFVEENQCIENCPYLLNKAQRKCHLNKCPPYLIISSDSTQCLSRCKENEFIRYFEESDLVKCYSLSYLESRNANPEYLPSFKLEVIPAHTQIIAVLRFSFDSFQAKSVNEILQGIKFSVQRSLESDQILSSSSLKLSQVSSQRTRLTQQQNITNINFQIKKAQKRQNAILISLCLTDFNEQAGYKFEQNLILTAEMKNPYINYFQNIDGENFPLQNYKQQVKYDMLNYSSQTKNYLGLSVFMWLLIISSVGLGIAIAVFKKKLSKLYFFASLVEFYQILYFLTFASINLPPLIESLFFSFRFSAGNLLVSALLSEELSWKESTQIMMSPWQFYKYAGEIHLFKNISDVLILLGVVVIILSVSKAVNHFTKYQHQLTSKLLKSKVKIFEIFFWTFSPIIGFYSIVNITYSPEEKKYQSQLQTSMGYKILCYIFSIAYFFSAVYFFYKQFSNKTMFDKGINDKKRKLGVSIGLYRYFRKILFVFFLAYYYENSIHGVCIFLLSTSIVFIMVYWFEPYKNPLRQLLSIIEEASLIVLFAQILIFLLNPDYYAWISVIIVIHIILHIFLVLTYPSYWLFMFIKQEKDIEKIEIDPNDQEISEGFFDKDQKTDKDKQIIEQQDDVVQENNSAETKINFKALIKKMDEENPSDYVISAHEADQSDQGEVVKKTIVNNVIRLAKKQTKKVKMFKNYDFSSDQEAVTEPIDQLRQSNKKDPSSSRSKKYNQ